MIKTYKKNKSCNATSYKYTLRDTGGKCSVEQRNIIVNYNVPYRPNATTTSFKNEKLSSTLMKNST